MLHSASASWKLMSEPYICCQCILSKGSTRTAVAALCFCMSALDCLEYAGQWHFLSILFWLRLVSPLCPSLLACLIRPVQALSKLNLKGTLWGQFLWQELMRESSLHSVMDWFVSALSRRTGSVRTSLVTSLNAVWYYWITRVCTGYPSCHSELRNKNRNKCRSLFW